MDNESTFESSHTEVARVLICPDSFKGSISSADAGRAMARGISQVFPDAELVCVSIADGGEGTLDALVPAENRIEIYVSDPVGKRIKSEYGCLVDEIGTRTAVIESARAAGLTLLSENERDPRLTSTYGVGEMIKDALDRGFERILLTVGGSATNDCGCGMAAALGARFYGADGECFVPAGGSLSEIKKIDVSDFDRRLSDVKIHIACDVKNPLTGKHGSSAVYAPQKGADSSAVAELERGMVHCAAIISKMCGRDVSVIPGAGAAGGIGVPLIAFCGARMISGIDAVLDAVGFDGLMIGCDAVITGEGRIDAQSLCGKAVSGIARRAKARGVPTYVICGSVGDGIDPEGDLVKNLGIKGIASISDESYSCLNSTNSPNSTNSTNSTNSANSTKGVTIEYSMTHAAELIEHTAKRLALRMATN